MNTNYLLIKRIKLGKKYLNEVKNQNTFKTTSNKYS